MLVDHGYDHSHGLRNYLDCGWSDRGARHRNNASWRADRARKLTVRIGALNEIDGHHRADPGGQRHLLKRCRRWTAGKKSARNARLSVRAEPATRAHSRLSMVVKLSVAVRPSSMSSGSPTSSDTSYLDCSCLILVKFVSALARVFARSSTEAVETIDGGERRRGEALLRCAPPMSPRSTRVMIVDLSCRIVATTFRRPRCSPSLRLHTNDS